MSTNGTGTNDLSGWQDADEGRVRAYLQRFLQDNVASLQAIIRGYVIRMNIAAGNNVETIASEIFQETVIEVLSHASRYNPSMQPRAWFLAIAANMLKRHKVSHAKRYRFEVLLGDSANNQDILDRLITYLEYAPGPEQALIEQESVREMLALVSQDDARLLNMVFLQGWDADALASTLGITPGTARVRVHRALSRLRDAWRQSEQRKERGKRNG